MHTTPQPAQPAPLQAPTTRATFAAYLAARAAFDALRDAPHVFATAPTR